MKRSMVEMVLPHVLESALKGPTRKSAACLKAAAEAPDPQDANEHREGGLPNHPILFGVLWAIGITDEGLHFIVFTPLRGVSPLLKKIESILRVLRHRHADSDQRRTGSGRAG